MEKLAIGPGYQGGLVTLDMTPTERIRRLARAKGTATSGVMVACWSVRGTGAHRRDPRHRRAHPAHHRRRHAGVIHCAESAKTGIDMYMGSGGGPEGVLAAAALKCT